jgi:DNA-binding HxlR family transcriptional regulator
METVEPSFAFDIRQKQQLVYASLMRFGSETLSLRNRCLEHVIMNSLLGTSTKAPLKIGEIQNKLHFGTHAPIVRMEVLRPALKELERDGKVSSVLVKKKSAYYLTETGTSLVNEAVVSAESLLKPVIGRLLRHTDHLISGALGAKICTSFICEAFARCGQGIAKDLQGQADFPHHGDLAAAFDAAVSGTPISDETRQTLEARCLALFKSRDMEDIRLIFYLTQGYYFAQLLGLDQKSFDPISDQAFAGAVFYLDTNVLLPGLLPGDGGRAFVETLRVAKRIGITLRVTRASLNEARTVAADRLRELKQIEDKVPAELAEKSLDDFITNFYEQRESCPGLTPEEYLQAFERLTEVVESWGVELDDIIEDEMLKGRQYPDLGGRIQALAAKYRRGRTKSENVLRHDVAHYALIQDRRATNGKTWFLTRDRSLVLSAEDICREGTPFCFGLIGFLQSISPFVISDLEGASLSTIFALLLKEQIITTDKLFDSRELVLLAEMHSDVLSTAAENLLPAVDFVKFSVLKGKAYRTEDLPLVSLELRKFLASSKDQQKKALEVLNAMLRGEAASERQAAAENRSARIEAERALFERERQLEGEGDKLRSAKGEIDELHAQVEAGEANQRLRDGLGGIAIGTVLWIMHSILIANMQQTSWTPARLAAATLQPAAGFLFCFPALRYLRNSNWRPEIRIGLGTLILFAAIWITKIVSPSVAADVASYVAIAAALAGVFVFRNWTPPAPDNNEP